MSRTDGGTNGFGIGKGRIFSRNVPRFRLDLWPHRPLEIYIDPFAAVKLGRLKVGSAQRAGSPHRSGEVCAIKNEAICPQILELGLARGGVARIGAGQINKFDLSTIP